MPPLTVRALLTSFAALVLPFAAFSDAPDPKPDAAVIARWIERLGDDDFDKREEASQKLEAAGEAALPALHEAAEKHADAEVRARAGKIARRHRQGSVAGAAQHFAAAARATGGTAWPSPPTASTPSSPAAASSCTIWKRASGV